MTTAIPKTLRGWTFVQNAGTSLETIVGAGTQTAVPFERLQMTDAQEPSGPLKTLIGLFKRFVDRVDSATLGSRSIPFGAGGTVLLACAFTAGKTLTVPHRLGTTNVNALGWSRAGTGGFGSFALSSDGQSVIFTPAASFVADVYITVTTGTPAVTAAATAAASQDWVTDSAGGVVLLPKNTASWDLSTAANNYQFQDTVSVDHTVVWLSGAAPTITAPAGWSVVEPLQGAQVPSYRYSLNLAEGYRWRANFSGKLVIPY